MRNILNALSQQPPLRLAVILASITAVIILVLVVVGRCTPSVPPPIITNTVGPSETPTFDPTETPTVGPSAPPIGNTAAISTPSPFPTPLLGIIGTDLPANFRVGPWHDNSIKCDKDPRHDSVTIYGVEISGGTPPYQITLWQFNKELQPTTLIFLKRFVIFIDPVEVSKGEYVHVTITFQSGDTTSTWIDDLFYPYLNDPRC